VPTGRPTPLAAVRRWLPWNRGPDNPHGRYTRREVWLIGKLRSFYEVASLPFIATFLLYDKRIDPSYGLTWRKRFALARRMRRTTRKVQTGTSYRAHLAMAAKILAIPRRVEGVIVEAGCWKGGTTANLSLVADIVGRDLIVYDSFAGLPPATDGDRWASPLGEGAFNGELEEVRANVAANGAVDRCRFRKGWFADTLSGHTEPIVAAFVDVDYQASMHDCLLGLWPHLVDDGYLFVDEYTRLDFCAVFFSERFWATHFDRPPPGLMGAGTGVALGQYFLGPFRYSTPLQEAHSVGWTRKDFYGEWDYVPAGAPAAPLPARPYGADGWTTTDTPADQDAAARLHHLLTTTDEGRALLAAKLAEGGPSST
jgi:hypothetical protein